HGEGEHAGGTDHEVVDDGPADGNGVQHVPPGTELAELATDLLLPVDRRAQGALPAAHVEEPGQRRAARPAAQLLQLLLRRRRRGTVREVLPGRPGSAHRSSRAATAASSATRVVSSNATSTQRRRLRGSSRASVPTAVSLARSRGIP